LANEKKVCGRVCMLVHAYYPGDLRVRREAEALAEAGFEVHVVCIRQNSRINNTREPSNEIVRKVHVHRLPLTKKRGSKLRYFFEYAATTLLGLWKLAILHLRKRFDVVHIHNMPDILVVAGLIPKWTGAVLVLDVHDPMNELFQENYHFSKSNLMIRMLILQEWVSYRMANYLITVNNSMAENVAMKRRCAKEVIKVVHNFPDLNLFPIREDRKQWPFNRDTVVFLYSGTVTEHYRLDIAVRAFAIVSRTIPGIKFQILGEGNRLDEVHTLAKGLGINDRVEHLPPVDAETVKKVMANADVGISTHQSGVFGDLYFSTKIIEFMTQGLPVISSRTYTIEKYIPEDSIFYFEPEQAEDLAKQIIFMLNNPGLVLQKIENSKSLLSKYTWQEEKIRFISYYNQIVSRS